MDPRLANDIKQAESCRLVAYQDSNGYWTIGWGHKLGEPAKGQSWAGYTISQFDADNLLNNDIARAAVQCTSLAEWSSLDTPCRQNAVIELVFNMGIGTWEEFVRTRKALEQQEWQVAHDELLDSAWAEQVHATRADRLANYLLQGEYPGP